MSLPLTPSQTAGPYLAIGLPWPDGPFVVAEGTPGAIAISGVVRDEAGEPVTDALVETWQAAPDGRRHFPSEGSGVVSVRTGKTGYSICGNSPVSVSRKATISSSSLSVSLAPSWAAPMMPTACLRLQTWPEWK